MSIAAKRDPGSGAAPVPDLVRRSQEAFGRLDIGLVLALALGLFAALPFLARGGLPHQTDAELHVYRTAELTRIIEEGVLYPRWAANLYLGYGYPIFNYYAPLTYHLGGVIARVLPGAGIVAGTKCVFVLGLVLAAVGAYLLGRELFNPAAGLVAMASFTLAPYVVFIDPHARGDLAEHFAVCLLPLSFYFVHRLLEAPSPGRLLGSVLAVAGVVFSHNLLGMVTSALLFAYWLWTLLVGRRRRNAAWGPAAFALAAGLIAFFWLPALLEYGAVRLDVVGPGHFDYREHFSSLVELLAPSRLVDWGATGPQFRHNLGLMQWMLAIAGTALLVRRSHRDGSLERAWETAFFAVGAMVLIFFMLPSSALLWELVPLMPYLQFPWRLLGPANLMLAVCGAGIACELQEGFSRRLCLVGVFAVLLTATLPLLYPAPWPSDFGGTEPADVLQWERESQALGTTATGDFLPTTVEVMPSVAKTMVASYGAEGPVDKINHATVPDDADVAVLSHGPTHDDVHVATPRPFILRLFTFHFPGWRAYVDGKEVEIEIGRPEGFITVPVPAGEYTVSVRFEDTPSRKLGWLVSACSIAALMAVLVVRPGHLGLQDPPVRRKLSRTHAAWFGGALLITFVFKVSVLDPHGWLYLESQPGEALVAQHETRANFANEIELLGYDLPRKSLQPGDSVSVVLYWHALGRTEKNYQSFVHIAEPLDTVWTQEDHLNPGGLPTSRWPLDKYVWDAYTIDLPAEIPPGEYRIHVGLYSKAEGHRLTRLSEEGEPLGDGLVIGSVTVSD